ncbi:uncharacterized protein BO66DRAFT_443711 [Aspergillus aculeatinus CBS 121060]|uniref:Uncharacterized protein n=1 Tax=Aspergillus aculeatinus CBS 121060 TaxID=1448322 RepID=A0ACD1GTT3_9EURO|nr:hypothetical protein BO66DRAFT_443711 [Aspergillus aculeatinus CBS 121060]RAH64781.1 hypothetical protein BO66DRAFT_443711 [Aspergillus aculeatinus CBS 121060]
MSSSETYETRYSRYKRSTRNVAIWLAVTDLDFKPPKQGEYILTASQFVELANNIVACKYADHVPGPIVSDLRYTIDSRRAQSKFYQDEGSASYKSHQHFIQQLEQLYETLRPLILDDKKTPLDADDEPDTAAMANRFDGLKIEEPSKEFLDASDAPARSTCPTENFTVEDSTDREFGVLLLLQDLWSIRQPTQKTWADYRQGKCTLEAAAVTTDIALHVAAEILHEGLKPFSEDLQGFDKIMTSILQEMYRTAPQDRPYWHEVVRNLHMVAETLHFVIGGWKEDSDGVLSEGTAPVLDLSRALDEMTDNERGVVAFVLLKEVVRECGLWGVHHPRLCATMDWFTMMLGHGLSQRAINYELAFAGLVYIDIRLAMGAEVAQPRLQLQEWTQSTTALIKQLSKTGAPGLEQLEDFIRITKKALGKDHVNARRESLGIPTEQPFGLFSCQPLLAGKLLWLWKGSLYRRLLILTRSRGVLLGMFYLYNAVACEGLLPDGWTWPALQQLIDTLNPVFLGGKLPTERARYRSSLQFSLSPKGRARWVDDGLIPLMNQMVSSLQNLQLHWTSQDIQRVLADSNRSTSTKKTDQGPPPPVYEVLDQLRRNLNLEADRLSLPWLQCHLDATRILQQVLKNEKEIRRSPLISQDDLLVGVAVVIFSHKKERKFLGKVAQIMKTVLESK